MQKNIAVDNDDILFDFMSGLVLFHNEVYLTNFKKEDYFSYNFHEVWGGTREQATLKIAEFLESNYFKNIKPKEGAVEAMRFLKDKGHNLFVITGRQHFLTEKTESDIQIYFSGIFSGICFANTYGPDFSGVKIKKSILCRKVNSGIIIEDDLLHINDCASAGIRVIAQDNPWNQGTLPKNATRVFDWKKTINLVADYSLDSLY